MGSRILTEIWIYPIKSLGGIRLKSSRVMEKGLQYDRRWMLIDEDNIFLTQRIFQKMALLKTNFIMEPSGHPSGLRITHRNEFIDLPFDHPLIETPISSKIWDDDVTTYEVSANHSEWFSDQLSVNARLVSFKEESLRSVDAKYQINNEQVSLADAYPLLIIGQSSLDDLNSKMDVALPMNRFRPNLVFTGGQPFEEDGWKNFKVGKNRFFGAKPCARCIMTTVNQDTAEKGIEPLVALSKYRKNENKVLFGQNVIAIDKNEIYEGDEIVVE
jgi:uncharacterized protein